MAYSAMQIANAFIQRARNGQIADLTPMKLQKLMFLAQSWYLKNYEARLIDDTFYRWDYGPVIPSVYYEFKSNGGAPITEFARDFRGEPILLPLHHSDENFLDEIIQDYGQYSGWELSNLTHQRGTAWSNGSIGSIITEWDMYDGKL